MNWDKIFISGIGTDVGKTVIAAIVTEALKADYWKPIQCGDLDNSDSIKISSLISNDQTTILPEFKRFKHPVSPHMAAEAANEEVNISDIRLPNNNPLVIEGAGGILVPINYKETFADFAQYFQLPVLVVSRNYLGSIHHTLSTIEVLQNRKLKIAGIIFNGPENKATEDVILQMTGLPCLLKVDWVPSVDREFIKEYAAAFRKNINGLN